MYRRFYCASLVICVILFTDNYANAATVEQMNNAARGLRNTCIGKTGVDPALVAGMKDGEFPADEQLQCYCKCIMTVLRTMKNGRLLLEPMIKQIKMMMPPEMQDRVVAVAEHCMTQEYGDNPCVTAWQVVKCQYERDTEVYFFP